MTATMARKPYRVSITVTTAGKIDRVLMDDGISDMHHRLFVSAVIAGASAASPIAGDEHGAALEQILEC